MKTVENAFERLLWSSRYLVLVAVVMGLVVAVALFVMTTADGVRIVGDLRAYVGDALDATTRAHLHAELVARTAETIDGYLFGTIAIIFSLGLYELFISKIDAAENSELAKRVLLISSLDDLKERLAKVVFLILVVRYFEAAVQAPLATPLDLLYLAIGIALVAGSLYVTGRRHRGPTDAS